MRSLGTTFISETPPFQGGRGDVKRFDLKILTTDKRNYVTHLPTSFPAVFSPTARFGCLPW